MKKKKKDCVGYERKLSKHQKLHAKSGIAMLFFSWRE
jgi:hypothetical protein